MKGMMFVSNEHEAEIVRGIVTKRKLDLVCRVGTLDQLSVKEMDDFDAVIGYYPKIDRAMLKAFAEHGIKYYITRSTGYNHVDLQAASEYGIHVANVRAYSPNAIAELALALVMALNRNLAGFSLEIQNQRFIRPVKLFKEIRDCTVGILGTGSIGVVSAGYYAALGARVIGYDKFPNPALDGILQYRTLSEVIEASDILLIHMPYIQNETHHIINREALEQAKPQLIIVNTARGELVNLADINMMIEEERLGGYGADVFEHEEDYIGKDPKEVTDPAIKKALALYPRIILTPHVGASTERALVSMIEIAIEDFAEYAATQTCRNEVIG
ncbi:MAG: NAD(P)-dependent oxidoreductase [Erysipelotrichaceae bacterium]|nr:NAD(P)-dependent oxidoreductase [Erysipelotrichaceae bacterium]